MKIYKVKKATKEEAIKYLMPVLRQILNLDLPYKITDKNIIIPIPRFLPIK